MQCRTCNDGYVYRNSTQEAAKSDSKFSSSSALVDINVSLNKRKKWKRSRFLEVFNVLALMFMRHLELKIF